MKTSTVQVFLLIGMTFGVFCYKSCARRVCYYTNWSQYRRPTAGKFLPENIDPSLCTHLIYAFAKIVNNSLRKLEHNDREMYIRFNNVKKANKKLKTLLAVGGWDMGSGPFTSMVSKSANRLIFIRTAIGFLRRYKFDGLNVNWAYPGTRGSPPGDKERFTYLVQETKAAFVREAKRTKREQLLLSVTVSPVLSVIQNGYEINRLSEQVDMFDIIAYDFYGSWDKVTGHPSPLYCTALRDRNCLDWAIRYYIEQGAPAHKINVGLITYGRSFLLRYPDKKSIGAPSKGAGYVGNYTSKPGLFAYYEICKFIQKGAEVTYLPSRKVPYLVDDLLWAGYEDVNSLAEKVIYARKMELGGVYVWTLDLDDFEGVECRYGPYPLLKAIYRQCFAELDESEEPETTNLTTIKITPRTTAKLWTTTPNPKEMKEFCSSKPDGMYEDPTNCKRFLWCTNNKMFRMQCAPGTAYLASMSQCVHMWQVPTCN